MYFRRLFVLLSMALTAMIAPAVAEEDAREVVKRIDELYRADTSYAEVEMEIVTRHWQRTLRAVIWTEGKTKTLIRIQSPPKERGVATLRLDRQMWNYLPRANKVIKIPPSMMMSSWMGSDFTNDDLVKEFTLLDDYHFKFANPEDARPGFLYIELKPKKGVPVVWSRIVMAVEKESYLPLWDRYYDEKNRLMRVIHFRDVRRFDGRRIPSVMEVAPQDKEGQKTVLRYLKAEFNRRLPAGIFSLRSLRSGK